MYIILLGGNNDENGNLSNSTIIRLNKFFEVYEQNENLNPRIIISGGFRFSQVSHCELIKNEILHKYSNITFEKEFIENNNTIDEAINISKYLLLKKYIGKIIIITSSYHMKRVKYLFNKTFEKIKKIDIEFIETFENNNDDIINEENYKLEQLVKKPYGKWLEYITHH